MRIRHYGITANRHRDHKLARARQLLGQPPLSPEPSIEKDPAVQGADSTTPSSGEQAMCPACGGRLRVVEVIAAGGHESPLRFLASRDTS